MDQNTALPARPDELTKMTQSNSLAAIVPQIMNAIGGGDQRTQQLLAQQQQGNAEMLEKQKEQMFMRSIMSPTTGEITPDLIRKNAALYGIPQEKAMETFIKFDAFRKAKKAEKTQAAATTIGMELVKDPAKFKSFLDGVALPGMDQYSNEEVFGGAKMASEFNSALPKPQLAESYNLDGTASFIEKKEGATFNPKPKEESLQRVPDGKGGFRFVKPVEGMTGMENPSKDTDKKSSIGKLIQERDSLPKGDPNREIYDQAIKKETTSSVMSVGNEMADVLAKQVVDGRLDFNTISKRGGLQQAVAASAEKMAPGVNLVELSANAKFKGTNANLTSRALIGGVQPLYDKLLSVGETLHNSRYPVINKAVNFAKEQTGDSEIVAFNNLRDDVIAETERILLGSGVLSDTKYQRALQNVNSAQSYPQLKAAVAQLEYVVEARLEALDDEPYKNARGSKEGGSPEQPAKEQPKNNDPLGIR